MGRCHERVFLASAVSNACFPRESRAVGRSSLYHPARLSSTGLLGPGRPGVPSDCLILKDTEGGRAERAGGRGWGAQRGPAVGLSGKNEKPLRRKEESARKERETGRMAVRGGGIGAAQLVCEGANPDEPGRRFS